MKRLTSLLLFFMVSFGASAQVLTLEECFKRAESHHPKSKEMVLFDESLQLRLDQLDKNFLPQLSFEAQTTYQSDVTQVNIDVPGMNLDIPSPDKDQYKATLNLSQTIYDGGITKASRKIEEVSSGISKQQVEVSMLQVRESVSKTYFSVLLMQQQKAQLLTIREKLEVQLHQIRSSVQNGMAIPSDTNLVKVELVKLDNQIRQLERNRLTAFSILEELTGEELKPSRKLEVPQYDLPAESTFEARPEMKLLDLQASRIDQTKALQDRLYRPKVAAFGTAGYGRPGLNMLSNDFESYWIVGAKVSWNLWNWNKAGDEKKILTLQQNILQKEKEALEQNLNVSLLQKESEINDFREMTKEDRKVIELYKDIVESHASRLKNGTITPAEFIDQLNNQKNAQLNFELHQIQLEKAIVDYLLTLGKFNQ